MKRHLVLVAVLGLIVASSADAQRRRGYGYYIPGTENNVAYDGRFTFARIRYDGTYKMNQEGPGWSHDYPDAERNFVQILKEITLMKPFMEGSVIMSPNDPELFKFPVAYLSHPGGWELSETDVESMRAYLQKGGFLIYDDWVDEEYFHGIAQIKRILPGADVVRLDSTHPIFDSFFKIDDLQSTSPNAVFFGIHEDNDPKKRLMAILNYNNDLGENWQYSHLGFNPVAANESYKLGVNYIIYAMTR